MLWCSCCSLQCNRTGNGFSVSLTVAPEDDETDLLGKLAGDLQEDVYVHDHFIEGTLKHVTGYTGFSGDPALQEGNYLALKMTATAGSTTKVQVYGDAPAREVTLDEDMNIVIRVADKKKQRVKVITTGADGTVVTRDFSLNGLTLKTV